MTLKNDRAPARARGAATDVSPPEPVETHREPPNLHIVPIDEDERAVKADLQPRLPARAAVKMREKQAAMLDRGLQATIGSKLRDFFADVAQEPVPDRLVQLLEALDAKKESDRE